MKPDQAHHALWLANFEINDTLRKLEESGHCAELLPELLALQADVAHLCQESLNLRAPDVVQVVGLSNRVYRLLDPTLLWLARAVKAPFVRGEWEVAEAAHHLRRAQATMLLAAHATHRSRGATREPQNSGTIPTPKKFQPTTGVDHD